MKIDLTQSRKDWMIYVLTTLVSAVLHLGLTLILLSVPVQQGPGAPAIEAHLGGATTAENLDEQESPEGPELAAVLQNWKSELTQREKSILSAVESRVAQLEREGSRDLEEGWTTTNAGSRLKTMCLSLGVDLQTVELKEDDNRYDFHYRLGGQPDTIFRDLALLTHLTGAATRKSRFRSDDLRIDILEPGGRQVGQFQVSTSKSRDFQRGTLSLGQLVEGALQPMGGKSLKPA